MSKDKKNKDTNSIRDAKGSQFGNRNFQNNYKNCTFNISEGKFTQFNDTDQSANREITDSLECPYLGLSSFNKENAKYFFGREKYIEKLLKIIETKNFVSIIGASGSGKSSLVLGGLIYTLEQNQKNRWRSACFRPQDDPFYYLAAALIPLYELDCSETDKLRLKRELAESLKTDKVYFQDVIEQIQKNNFQSRILIIVDQFEEIFTLCNGETRSRFLNCLLSFFHSPSSQLSTPSCVLITTMRGNFIDDALEHPLLADLLQDSDLKLGSMNHDQLKGAIEKPAQLLGISYENGLVNSILKDLENQLDRSSSLPLLEFALTELWIKHTSGIITHADYKSVGEVSGALTRYADNYYQRLEEKEQSQCRSILVKLVRLNEDNANTKKRASREVIGEENWSFAIGLNGLINSRLVVVSTDTDNQEGLEIVHEALIYKWKKLACWVTNNRNMLIEHQRYQDDARLWQKSGKKKGYLLEGLRLKEANKFIKNEDNREILSDLVKNFILRSKKEERYKIINNLILPSLLFSVLLIFSIIFISNKYALAVQFGETEKLLNSGKYFDALISAIKVSRQIKRNSIFTKYDTKIEASANLQNALNLVQENNRLEGHKGQINKVSYSSNGKYIASASGKDFKLWSEDGELLYSKLLDNPYSSFLSFHPNKDIVAFPGNNYSIDLVDIKGNLLASSSAHQSIVNHAEFSPDGELIASVSKDGTVKLWDIEKRLFKDLGSHIGQAYDVKFSPDGKILASGGGDGKIKLWNIEGYSLNELITTIEPPHIYSSVNNLDFSPDGKRLASAHWDNKVRLWDLEGKIIKDFPHEDRVEQVKFSPDGKILASASQNSKVKLWNLKGELLGSLTHENGVEQIKFSPDGKILFSLLANERTVKMWSVQKRTLLGSFKGHIHAINDIDFSPDLRTLVSASVD
ncbi:MAG: hypothetical protein AAFO95_08735, partial [Cyanobacteria bacterium J06600_6]